MRNLLALFVLALAAHMAFPAPGRAAQESHPWSMLIEVPLSINVVSQFQGGMEDRRLNKEDGLGLSIGTPYHVGFGIESFSGTFDLVETVTITTTTTVLTVYVDIPVPLLLFHLGGGWGQLSFDPSSLPDDEGTRRLETVTVWQWFARLGVPLPGSLHAMLGYREARGEATNRNRDKTPIDVNRSGLTQKVMTLGIGYTF